MLSKISNLSSFEVVVLVKRATVPTSETTVLLRSKRFSTACAVTFPVSSKISHAVSFMLLRLIIENNVDTVPRDKISIANTVAKIFVLMLFSFAPFLFTFDLTSDLFLVFFNPIHFRLSPILDKALRFKFSQDHMNIEQVPLQQLFPS
ncbi:hypothetical protein SDC9_181656 [bioreactor metagenome]|uniref:Uncharacterized protein n=1 Tax=bioreactor metagenome TaxID=1076179 RepID=A0A645HEG1_9ZZZZ